jgi:phosphoribosylanthranilate isomerase
MSVRVKICGLTRLEDALAAVAAGADALGFNFWKGSKRYLEPARAASIVRLLPPFVTTVGIFVNETREQINLIADQVRLSTLQLHGDESPRDAANFSRPVIKAIRVESAASLAQVTRYEVAGVLLDAPSQSYGGSGNTFDWSQARALPQARVILAGGLDPANVGQAIRTVRPFAVDVASGVESAPGIKDVERMKRFIQAAKREGALP